MVLSLLHDDHPKGLLRTPASYASIVAAATTTTLYQISPNRFAKITKLFAYSAVTCLLQIGVGAFTQVFPDIKLLAGVDRIMTEDEFPEYWFGLYAAGDITGQASVAAVSPNDVRVLVEVRETGP